ncbi:MAG: AmmeMemoRadiSam system radical SAM enzyme [Desulfobacterales bacterium]|nr:AmmeMemoRadiSam system radical SAM enzyme [Desulfobacterales bacterium]
MEARCYTKLEKGSVQCYLCRHRCLIQDKERGICKVRENQSGTLITLVYGKIIACHVDPVEKKPLFHFMPGSQTYSLATVGCNFRCKFCQNSSISQMPIDHHGMIMGDDFTPSKIVELALLHQCKSISFTYTEPTIFFEFAIDTAMLAKEKGLYTIFVSNGYMSDETIELMSGNIHAANIDLKAFNSDFYKQYCGAKLENVLKSLRTLKAKGIFLEITTLLIPGLNDEMQELKSLAEFIVSDLGAETPWHISRFHPTYQLLNRPQTPVQSLLQAREIGIKAGLRYVYVGNVPGEKGESTFCWKCGKLLIDRHGFFIRDNRIKNNRCSYCDAYIDMFNP